MSTSSDVVELDRRAEPAIEDWNREYLRLLREECTRQEILLIFVGGALSATTLPAMVKYLVTVAIVVPAVMGTYHYGVRRSLLGRLRG